MDHISSYVAMFNLYVYVVPVSQFCLLTAEEPHPCLLSSTLRYVRTYVVASGGINVTLSWHSRHTPSIHPSTPSSLANLKRTHLIIIIIIIIDVQGGGEACSCSRKERRVFSSLPHSRSIPHGEAIKKRTYNNVQV